MQEVFGHLLLRVASRRGVEAAAAAAYKNIIIHTLAKEPHEQQPAGGRSDPYWASSMASLVGLWLANFKHVS